MDPCDDFLAGLRGGSQSVSYVVLANVSAEAGVVVAPC